MRLPRITTVLLLTTLLAFGAGFEKRIVAKSAQVELSAQKPLAVGENRLTLHITRDNKPLSGADVEVKFFMPAMPGMPYMEARSIAQEEENGNYAVTSNFSMRGTWQLHLFITPKTGKKFRIKSSVNI